ncbi:MAG: TlpA family protein disulfide reductase [Planctomycetaceae bacterium]|jgi:glutathione peroxidase-family protein|nr:TlpA family protein disulfide reductase [Planctomycetaceae bacterium]
MKRFTNFVLPLFLTAVFFSANSNLPLFAQEEKVSSDPVVSAGADVDAAERIKQEIQGIAAQPMNCPPEEYKAFLAKKGAALTELADKLLTLKEVSPEDKKQAIDFKRIGLVLQTGTDKKLYYEKIWELLEEIKNIPEAEYMVRSLIEILCGNEINQFYTVPKSEVAVTFRKVIDKYAPLINAHFEKAESNEQLPSILVSRADLLDSDGSEKLAIYAAEKLSPIFEKDLKRKKFDLLYFCAKEALGVIHRYEMIGNEMEFEGVDINENLVDIKNYRGKTVLLIFGSHYIYKNKIAELKKLYETLKDNGLEIIYFDAKNDPNISAKMATENGISWVVTTRDGRYKKKETKEKDYVEIYGSFDNAFLIDRNGKLIKTNANGISPKICESLKTFFPDKTKVIDEIAAGIRRVDEKSEQDTKKYFKKEIPVAERKPVDELYMILNLLNSRNSNIVQIQIQNQIADAILVFPDFQNRLRVLQKKVDVMRSMGFDAMRKNPKLKPEIAFQDVDKFLETAIKEAEGNDNDYLLLSRLAILSSMVNYLDKVDNPVQYAEEISKRYIDFIKMYVPKITDYENVRTFALFFTGKLEDIDTEHSTTLLKTFIGEVKPIFVASKDLELQEYAKQLDGMERRASLIGKELEFECVLLNGEKLNVKDLRGKIVLVNFWGTTCGPCLREFPQMKKLYEKYKPKGYEMIAYSRGDDTETLNAFAEKTKYPWLFSSTVLSKEKGNLKNYSDFYGINGVPTTFILDRKGIVRFMMTSSNDEILTREIDKMFE